MKPIFFLCALCLFFSNTVVVAESSVEQSLNEMIDSAESGKIKLEEVKEFKLKLWEKYKKEETTNVIRLKEFNDKKMSYLGVTMRYDYSVIGKKPSEGRSLYIALHGGGGAPARVNDSQWNHMKVYYKESVDEGVYLAARGVSDTWNLHFNKQSYVLYDRLIENMILFENVNPNRVYIMGFSAGGDGVYRIAPKMADRWAAASMSAGHPGDVKAKNLYRLPFLLQVGEVDTAYNRHMEAAKFDKQLQDLKSIYSDGFVYQTFIHLNKPHNFFDMHPKEVEQEVIASPQKWLNKQDRTSLMANTNAVSWLKKHNRNPWPTRVIWDLTTCANRQGLNKDKKMFLRTKNRGLCHYWLQISEEEKKITEEIDVVVDKKNNAIKINKIGNSLTILLNQEMCDLSKDIIVSVEGKTFKVKAEPHKKNMIRSLLDRGDPYYIFEASLFLEKNSKGMWVVTATSS